jgi:hypothetical protein
VSFVAGKTDGSILFTRCPAIYGADQGFDGRTLRFQLIGNSVSGNKQGSCFSRQISMYLAKHVGGWSMVKIGRFYNGRHHTTVLHAIQKVQRFRSEDESIDGLVQVLIVALRENVGSNSVHCTTGQWPAELVETITAQVLCRLAELRKVSPGAALRPTSVGSEYL